MPNSRTAFVIIPARGGSKGVKHKNLREINGKSLIARCVTAAVGAATIDRVYVSSDSPDILTEATRFGAISVLRPDELSGDVVSSESVLVDVLRRIQPLNETTDILVFLQCTSPFTTSLDINHLVAALDDPSVDCALTVSNDHSFLWTYDECGFGIGVNHDARAPRARRQELKSQYRENGAGYAMRVNSFLKVQRRFCGKVAFVITDFPPIEIDDEQDMQIAEQIAKVIER